MTITLNYNPMQGGYKTDPTLTNKGRELITFETLDANLLADQREFALYRARYDEIMRAIQAGEVDPDNLEVLFELGQLSDLLGIAPVVIGDSHD